LSSTTATTASRAAALEPATPRLNRDTLAEFCARLFVGALFLLLSMNLLADFWETRRITGLLLLVSETLVLVLTIVRRKATLVDRSLIAAVVTTTAVTGPFLLRASNTGGLMPDAVTAALSVAGLIVVIAGKLVLGRSFGIVPANRGVVTRGPYLYVRHPIYTGYLITHVGFLAAHPTVWNALALITADLALVIRALYEERVLRRDAQYREYCTRVRWHLVPGVF
jgi:protein-S-isoprenylcysteine O-methyltransferase Ste14